jgi:hypothetical protein
MRTEPATSHVEDGAPRIRAPKGATCLQCHTVRVRREGGKPDREGGRECGGP